MGGMTTPEHPLAALLETPEQRSTRQGLESLSRDELNHIRQLTTCSGVSASQLLDFRTAVQHGCAEKVRAQAQGYICPCGCGDCFGQSACEDLADLLDSERPGCQGSAET